uniref:Uncharacterized protein n=1 Tax=Chromera velia CCMP2878 TaxID=1169474 RepID=A0A0G4IB88_9ALVE|eukprot:Cvel_2185.t1-p1 / transcript=Cvel_2185.t1 / gene=Cvel_2185 / organism=Chromera_velia_CCMP2878 / gene_product=hypothetical protein / transcript_product=hypothetical protein / location=Cvel_scaffold84:132047-133173(+) / protein_length=161 / sequence_SO=supercontig / SO=protein_coding / is_pseudo=false
MSNKHLAPLTTSCIEEDAAQDPEAFRPPSCKPMYLIRNASNTSASTNDITPLVGPLAAPAPFQSAAASSRKGPKVEARKSTLTSAPPELQTQAAEKPSSEGESSSSSSSSQRCETVTIPEIGRDTEGRRSSMRREGRLSSEGKQLAVSFSQKKLEEYIPDE